MAGYTPHYKLTTLGVGESLSTNDYAFTGRNLEAIDQKLYLGAEGHRHTGVANDIVDPNSPPSVSLVVGSGNIPGGRTLRYRYTIVDQYGQETAPSPEATVTTPAPLAIPGRPTLNRETGGTLLPGNYYYLLTAYKDANTLETVAGERAYTTLNYGLNENQIVVEFPTLPAGADGFNIYRRSPGSSRFQYLTTVDMSTPVEGYSDTGAVDEDCNRTVPNRDTSSTSNSVIVSLPGATPTLPEGTTWRIYRTYTANDYDSSLLHSVIEETSEGSGVILTTYTDIGRSTGAGKYPSQSEISGAPSKVLLTNMGEVAGTLPVGSTIIPVMVNFTFSGPLSPETGGFQWVSEYDLAELVYARAYLGVGSSPAVQDVIVDINKYNSIAETRASVLFNQSNRPRIDQGEMIGDRYSFSSFDTRLLLVGDALSVDIDQIGGGATPTDYNLVVNILLYVKVGSTTVSHEWAIQ